MIRIWNFIFIIWTFLQMSNCYAMFWKFRGGQMPPPRLRACLTMWGVAVTFATKGGKWICDDKTCCLRQMKVFHPVQENGSNGCSAICVTWSFLGPPYSSGVFHVSTPSPCHGHFFGQGCTTFSLLPAALRLPLYITAASELGLFLWIAFRNSIYPMISHFPVPISTMKCQTF